MARRTGYLKHLRVSNLACFGSLDIQPGATTLLVGPNGGGKSTLLDLLFVLRVLVNEGSQPDDVLPAYQPEEGPAEIELEVGIGRGSFRYLLQLTQHAGDASTAPRWAIQGESLRHDDELLTDFAGAVLSLPGGHQVPLSPDRSPLAVLAFAAASPVTLFKEWLGGVWMLRLEPRRMVASAGEPDDDLAVSGENFVAWLLHFRRRKKLMADVSQAIRPSMHGFDSLEFVPSGREWILVARFDFGVSVDFDDLSDGQRCLIVLHAVSVLVRDQCSLLLLDEPDGNVTPTEILPLFTALRERSEQSGVQVVVASHHPQVIDLLSAESPWEMTMKRGRVAAHPLLVDRAAGVSASRHLLLRGRR